jgi:hypothetical protein
MTDIVPFPQAIFYAIHKNQKRDDAYPLRLAGPSLFFLAAIMVGSR